MLDWLWLIPFFPFAGFVLLALAGARFRRGGAAAVGVGSIGLSAVVAILVAGSFLTAPPPGDAYRQTLWTWMDVGSGGFKTPSPGGGEGGGEGDFAAREPSPLPLSQGERGLEVVSRFRPEVALYLDSLSLVMVLVVTVVGFLIHLYSADYMIDEEGYSRFFAYMNLFVGAMLTLLLADNLLLLYLGWEGVGLCSYLLIGFWYADPVNGRAARKAFIVTRVGDTALAIGLFLLFTQLGTLQVQELMQRAEVEWAVGAPLAIAAAALLLGGAIGKSAQLPLQTWLPDAMAGPTPTSALIHAATMVTAGVYLIARTHPLFLLAPPVESAVAIIGAATLLVAGFSALTQRDLKRVLAYSTISQIGYMFLALGVGAWSAAIFHFMTHAFFKALLFLGAGVVILKLHHEHDMFKMGGLRKALPVTFWTFLIAAASLAALPLVTAGFYSKDLILWNVWSAPAGGKWLWLAGVVGALVTAVYTFRMVFLTFFGEPHPKVKEALPLERQGLRMQLPLVVLAVLSVVGGFVELPPHLGDRPLFTNFLQSALPQIGETHHDEATEVLLQIVAAVASLGGIVVAWMFFLWKPQWAEQIVCIPGVALLHQFWHSGWGFDWMYDRLFVRPYVWFAHANRGDFIDLVPTGIARASAVSHRLLSRTETGLVRLYAMGIAFGAVITVALLVFL